MNKLITKARSGVTLVELLVVILIVTILSVSMLPLLQPFVVEAQYAAEAIPVIGNIRTKVGIYQYDKGKLPCYVDNATDANGKITGALDGNPMIESWIAVTSEESTTGADASTADIFKAAAYSLPGSTDIGKPTVPAEDSEELKKHLQTLCDIDYQDLKGKRCKPIHYQYLVMRNGTDYAYFVGCFGDGNGLKMGTGYAVCEIFANGHKYVGTWKRYKPVSDESGNDVQVCFTTSEDTGKGTTKTVCCCVPTQDAFEPDSAQLRTNDTTGKLNLVGVMEEKGWEF